MHGLKTGSIDLGTVPGLFSLGVVVWTSTDVSHFVQAYVSILEQTGTKLGTVRLGGGID